MAKRNKIVFKATIDGEEKDVAVIRPNPTENQAAMRIYNKTVAESLRDGCLLKDAMENYVREQGIWGDEQEAELKKVLEETNALESKLLSGKMKKSEGRDIALKLRDLRVRLRVILAPKTDAESNTVQSHAEQAKLDYLVSVCTVYDDTGEKVFTSLEDYKERAESDEDWVWRCGAELSSIIYNLDPDYEKGLIENKFLKKFNFVDDKYRLVDEKGHLVARNGRKIDDEGFYVNDEGKRVDINGKLVEDKSLDDAEFYD